MIPGQYDIHALTHEATSCLGCAMRERCFTATLDDDDTVRVGRLVERRRTLTRGQRLYQAGAPVHGRVYVLRRGDVKIVQEAADGKPFIDRFPREGDIVGLDTISLDRHLNSAVTLNTVEMCELSFSALQRMASTQPVLRLTIFGMMQHQLQQQRAITLLLHNNNAQQRLMAALRALGDRQAQSGTGDLRLRLPMSRQDLADHLGIGRTTVSRLLNELQTKGQLLVTGRTMTIAAAPLPASDGQLPMSRPAGIHG